MQKVVPYILAVIMILGSIGHIASPELYAPMIPKFISPTLAHILAFIAELGIGVGLLIPKTRRLAGLGFALLMVAFLPLHIWDVIRDDPMMQSTAGAWIRLVFQFLLIYLGYRVWKK